MFCWVAVGGNIDFTNNRVGTKLNFTVDMNYPIDNSYAGFNWDNNEYFVTRSSPFELGGNARTWELWRSATGFDANSTISSDSPIGTVIDVRPNEYESGRGHAVVYNWDDLSSVQLDLSSIVPVGSTYQIRNVMTWFDAPVITGTYNGGTITLPMVDTTSPSPIGWESATPYVQSGEFGVFMIETTTAPSSGNLVVSAHDDLSELGAAVAVQADGSFTYDPTTAPDVQAAAAGQVLSDQFNYTAIGASGFDISTVTIQVTGVNDAPVAQDQTISTSNVALNETFPADDVDSDDSTSTLTYSITSPPVFGDIQVAAGGTFNFDPSGDFDDLTAGQTRDAVFTFLATDQHGASNSGVVTITVHGGNANNAPFVVSPITNATVTEGQPLSKNVAANFDDLDGDTLTFAATLSDGGALPGWLSFDGATALFSGTAPVDNPTVYVIDVTASDPAGAEISAVFVLTVIDDHALVVDLTPLNPFERKLDGSWWANTVASDGKVYFGSSTHAHDTGARIFQYDPDTQTVAQIGTELSNIVGEDPTVNVPQGKLHGPLVEAGGWLYSSMHLANYWEEAQESYTGAHVFGYQLNSLEAGNANFVDFGIPQAGFTAYAAVATDPAGQYIWSFGTPWADSDTATETAHLFRVHLASGTIQDFGEVTAGQTGARASFGIHVDNNGDAWLAPQYGGDKLYVARSATGLIESFDQALPVMSDQYNQGQPSAYQNGSWFTWGHSMDGNRFLFTMADDTAPFAHRSGGSLWEFDTSKILPGNDFSQAFREIAWIGGHNLSMAYSGGHVYFVRRSDGYHHSKIDGIVNNGESWDPALDSGVRLHLYSVDINNPNAAVTDWGMITDNEGRIPWRSQSLSADSARGEVYISADWIMKDTDPDEWKTLRHDAGLTTTYTQQIRGQAFAVANVTLPSAPPVLDSAIPDATVDEDSLFSYDTSIHFSDPDGDTLSFQCNLSGGGPLPSWISIDPHTGVISGTPSNDEVGTLLIQITASDPSSLSVSDSFALTINNTNDPPHVTSLIADVSTSENEPFQYDTTANFADVDPGDSITLSAQQFNGDPLPVWLTFTAGQFSGTPSSPEVIDVRVTATDIAGSQVFDDFVLTVNERNDPPIVVGGGIADVVNNEDEAFVYAVADKFNDPDAGDSLTFAAHVTGQGSLPGWLSFDTGTATFTGTPTNDDVGELPITVSATDLANQSVADEFTLTIINVNDPPQLLTPVDDAQALRTVPFEYDVSVNFDDVDVGDTLTFDATADGGSALPAWLTLDPVTGVFAGTPGLSDTGTISIDVVVSDGAGQSATDQFQLTVLPSIPLEVSGSGNLLLRRTPAGDAVEVLQGGTVIATQAWDLTSVIRINGNAGVNDTLQVDLSNGIPIQVGGLQWNGQVDDDDQLSLVGGSLESVDLQFSSSAAGTLSLIDSQGNAPSLIKLSGLSDLTIDAATNRLSIELPDDDNLVHLQRTIVGRSQVFGTSFPSIEFAHPTSEISIAGQGGEDAIEIFNLTLYGTDLALDAETVTVKNIFDTNGGTFQSSGDTFTSFNGARIVTDGGDLTLAHNDVQIGEYVLTGGGLIESVGSGSFQMVDVGAYFRTSGTAGPGHVAINHDSSVSLRPITTSGGEVSVRSQGEIWVRGVLNTRGSRPGSITLSGGNLVHDNSQSIYTTGGNVMLDFTGPVSIGESVYTGGGSFISTGAGSFSVVDNGAIINTSGQIGPGKIDIDHVGDVSVFSATTGGGNIELESAGNVTVRGNIITTGLIKSGWFQSSGMDFTLENGRTITTGGGEVVLQHDGTVLLDHSVTTSGGRFTSAGAGDFLAYDTGARIQTSGNGDQGVHLNHGGSVTLHDVTTGGGDLQINATNQVFLRGLIDTRGDDGGNVNVSANSFSSDRGKSISTGGGNVTLSHQGSVELGSPVTTEGGSFTSSGQGAFMAVDAAVSITTSGTDSDGKISLNHDGDLTTYRLTSGGGSISLLSRAHIDSKSWIDGRGPAGGQLKIAAASFTSANSAPVWTNGNVAIHSSGAVVIGEYIRTDGGDFYSTGNSTFTTLDSGAAIRTYGGRVSIDHTGLVDLSGLLDTGGGQFDLTLHVHSGVTGELFKILGNLDFNGGTLTVDMDGNSVDSMGGLPATLDEVIRYGFLVELPAKVSVIDRALTDGDFTASLVQDVAKTLDLVFAEN